MSDEKAQNKIYYRTSLPLTTLFQHLLESLLYERALVHLDDVAAVDTAEVFLKDFVSLRSTAKPLGREKEQWKSDVVGPPGQDKGTHPHHRMS